ncbi:MAG: LysR family transcriptional regulator [Pseudomonadota bacterium]
MNDMAPSPAARLDLDAMRAALTIAETGSVSVAASRLGRTPAAISMQLKKLEDTLGNALFNRTRSGMTLTTAGERLMPYARRMVETERAAREAFLSAALSGTVRLGLIDDVIGVHLTAMLAAFARSHPGVTVDVTVGPSVTLGPQLERGEVDIALITTGGPGVDPRDSDIVLFDEPLAWVVARTCDVWQERPLPLALSAHGCAWRRQTLEALERADIPHRVAYQSEFTTALSAAVAGGLAVSVLPPSAMPEGTRVVGPAEGAPPLGSAQIMMRLGHRPSGVTTALAARIAEQFGASLESRAS